MNDKIEKLLMRRAELLRQVKSLKPLPELDHCRFVPTQEQIDNWSMDELHETCIQRCYRLTGDFNAENHPYDGCRFHDMFLEMDPQPCAGCVEILRLKKMRSPLKRQLGNVNSQITQIGNRLLDGKH